MMTHVSNELAGELRVEHYQKTGKTWMTVKTASMAPLIRPQGRVLVSGLPLAETGTGEIIVFRRNGSLIGHRVLRKQAAGNGFRFLEKGDSSPDYGFVDETSIIGVVVAVKNKNAFLHLDSPQAMLISKALAIWFSSLYSIRKMLSASRYGLIIKTGNILTKPTRIMSGLLVRLCWVLWHVSCRCGDKGAAGLKEVDGRS